MTDVIMDSIQVYKENVKLVILFSIPFVIAFIIPLFAPFPTYTTAGAIFLRSASVFVNGNINLFSLSIITLSSIFSLLFLSFAFVLISLIVKARRTRTKIGLRAFQNIESYIGKVFTIFFLYSVLFLAIGFLGYSFGIPPLAIAIVEIIISAPIFYAPSATVVDDKKVVRALRDSVNLVTTEPQYFVLWLTLIFVTVSVVDYVLIHLIGIPWASWLVLLVNSLVLLPYFVIFQAQAYMSRFKLLKH